MQTGATPTAFVLICHACGRAARARASWTAREARCPHCGSTLRIPDPDPGGRPLPAQKPPITAKRGFNFVCPRCEVLLETHTGMCGNGGRCPTCAASFVIPHLDPASGLPDAATLLDEAEEQPAPLHAYAASGAGAPRIVRLADGDMQIECPRCGEHSEIDADRCLRCDAPFTMEAAAHAGSIRRDTLAGTALIMAFIGLPLCFLFVPSLLAIGLAVGSLWSGLGRGLSWRAVTAGALGVVGVVGGVFVHYL